LKIDSCYIKKNNLCAFATTSVHFVVKARRYSWQMHFKLQALSKVSPPLDSFDPKKKTENFGKKKTKTFVVLFNEVFMA
jgi:hypothetical protein